MTHTPSPWEVEDGNGVLAKCFAGTWKYVCQHVRGNNPAERDANARLIAAAPELLHAAKTVKAFLDGLEERTPEGDPLRILRQRVHAPLLAAVNAAIEKAEGS